MNSDTVPVTEELLEAGRSPYSGWSKAQLDIIGVKSRRGRWKEKALTRRISRLEAERFVTLRGQMILTVRAKRIAWLSADNLSYIFPKTTVIPEKYHGTYLVPERTGIFTDGQTMLDQFEEWLNSGWRVDW